MIHIITLESIEFSFFLTYFILIINITLGLPILFSRTVL